MKKMNVTTFFLIAKDDDTCYAHFTSVRKINHEKAHNQSQKDSQRESIHSRQESNGQGNANADALADEIGAVQVREQNHDAQEDRAQRTEILRSVRESDSPRV